VSDDQVSGAEDFDRGGLVDRLACELIIGKAG
jgi:hypothetical protein